MKKYFALYIAPVVEVHAMMEKMTEEDGKTAMAEWGAWMETHKAAIVDGGAALGKTKRVASNGVGDAKNDITGYSIVQAESHDEAAKIFQDHPHFKHLPTATIDVMDWIDMSV